VYAWMLQDPNMSEHIILAPCTMHILQQMCTSLQPHLHLRKMDTRKALSYVGSFMSQVPFTLLFIICTTAFAMHKVLYV